MKGLIFTYLLTYGGAAASLAAPYVGLLVYICFAVIKPESMWYWAVPAGNYSRIVAIALLLGWLAHGLGKWRFGPAKPIVYALLCYMATIVISALLVAEDKELAYLCIENHAKIILPFLVGITLISSMREIRWLAWVLLLSQGYVALEMNISYFQGFNRIEQVSFAGLDNNALSISIVTGIGPAFFFGLAQRCWWKRWLLFAAAGLMAHSILMSESRGGMLGLCVAGGVTAYLVPKTPKNLSFLFLGLVSALSMAGPSVVERFSSSFADAEVRDASSQSRLDLWADCWDTMTKHPLLGVGPEHWPLTAADYGWPAGKEAHSLWMQQGAELGFPGLLSLVGFYFGACWLLWKFGRSLRTLAEEDCEVREMMYLSLGTIAGLAGFVVSASFVSVEGIEYPYYCTLLAAGLLKVPCALPAVEACEIPTSCPEYSGHQGLQIPTA